MKNRKSWNWQPKRRYKRAENTEDPTNRQSLTFGWTLGVPDSFNLSWFLIFAPVTWPLDRMAKSLKHQAIDCFGRGGFLLSPTEDADTVLGLMSGQPYISQSIAEVLINQVRDPVKNTSSSIFTDKEKEVLKRVAEGRSNKEIAKETGMALRTVEAHISKIYDKLGTSSRTKAALWAKENGLI